MTTTMLHVRVDDQMKEQASTALTAMGVSVSEAVRMFLRRVVSEQALPFAVKVPNATTLAAMDEARALWVAEGKVVWDTLQDELEQLRAELAQARKELAEAKTTAAKAATGLADKAAMNPVKAWTVARDAYIAATKRLEPGKADRAVSIFHILGAIGVTLKDLTSSEQWASSS